ncbi:MAG: HAMP domain-containing sensor histidine kinase [Mariprofundaceae bacterium]|nr:HAMP domain-containing sensor histidine kinase [Mariprofundaceae bacterium]
MVMHTPSATLLRSKRLRASLHWFMHSVVYFMATLAALALFYILLVLAESGWYAVTGHSVSVWAMALAALLASLFFSPMVHGLQRFIDALFYRKRINTLQAIRELGAGDLARLPEESIEASLLQHMADIFQRQPILLDENGRMFSYPLGSPDPQRGDDVYEIVLPMEYHQTNAVLYLGPRRDGWMADAQEMENIKSIVRFAGMSLEHARLTRQQVAAARLDSLVRVTAQLHSHDLKNRLHDLSFLAHHMDSGKLDEEDIRRMTDAIRKVVGRMQSVMERMADPNAPIHPQLKACDVQQLLQQLVGDHLWPEGIKVEQRLDASGLAMIDAALFESVMNNLFDNAVQAMDKQGLLQLSLSIDDSWLRIAVCDHGYGMEPAFVEHQLFRLFVSSKTHGLGIGLYLSQRMIAALGGELRAESEGKGKGSTFIIRLPLWQDVRNDE